MDKLINVTKLAKQCRIPGKRIRKFNKGIRSCIRLEESLAPANGALLRNEYIYTSTKARNR